MQQRAGVVQQPMPAGQTTPQPGKRLVQTAPATGPAQPGPIAPAGPSGPSAPLATTMPLHMSTPPRRSALDKV